MRRAEFLAGTVAFAASPHAAGIAFENRMRAIVASIPGIAGVYACTMAAERPIFSYNATARFPSASIIKMTIMLTAYVHETRSPGALQQRIRYNSANLIGGSDFMSQQRDGATFSVSELITPMIQLSDNTAANALIGYFGVKEIDRVAEAAGLRRTHLARHFLDYAAIVRHEDNVTCPADMARLLFALERGAREDVRTVVPARYCRDMVRIMLGQTDKEGIPSGVPGVPVANKTGAIDGVRNDVAIVEPFGTSPFVLAIMTKELTSNAGAYSGMQHLAAAVYHRVGGTDL